MQVGPPGGKGGGGLIGEEGGGDEEAGSGGGGEGSGGGVEYGGDGGLAEVGGPVWLQTCCVRIQLALQEADMVLLRHGQPVAAARVTIPLACCTFFRTCKQAGGD